MECYQKLLAPCVQPDRILTIAFFLDPLFFTRVHQGYIYSSAHFSNVTTVIVRFSLNSLAFFKILWQCLRYQKAG